MSKSSSSSRWLQRQKKDPFVKLAQKSHYRSRAVYKLIEIDKKYRLFKPGQTVVDLGAAPGSWSQYLAEKLGAKAKIIAVDILEMENLPGVHFIQGDFTEQAVFDACLEQTGGQKVDLVISDMAPNISGIKDADQARSMYFAELVADFAQQVLAPGGHLLLKLFQGAGIEQYNKGLREHFSSLSAQKPKASRDSSREFYMLAKSFKL